MKSSFKVSEMSWLDTKNKVKHLKTRPLVGYIAHNERPPQICIQVTSGPNDLGVQKDILIDIKGLKKEMARLGV